MGVIRRSKKIRLITLFEAENGEALHSQQKQDWELMVAQIISSLVQNFKLISKIVDKTTTPFRYDLSQVTYDDAIEVTNRFKGLDLVDRGPEELRMEVHDIVWEAVIKIIPKKKKCKEARWLSEEAFQIAKKRREAKSKGEKERYSHLNAECQTKARRG